MIRIVIDLCDDGKGVCVEKSVMGSSVTAAENEVSEGFDAMINEYMDTVESCVDDGNFTEELARN